MARARAFTDRTAAAAKPPTDKAVERHHTGTEGLFLAVFASGGKAWQFRYKEPGTDKGQTLTIGKYPAVSLKQAQEATEAARRDIAAGLHPTVEKRTKRVKQAQDRRTTFEKIAERWMVAEGRRKGWSDAYRDEVEMSLRNHLSELDPLPITKVLAPVTAPILEAVARTAPAMEEKVERRLMSIMDYAVEIGALTLNPLPRRRRRKVERRHFPAVVKLPELGEILRAARASDPCKGIQRAHVLLVYTAQRVGEIVGATWDEIDLEQGLWSIPRARMKRKDEARGPHLVPLPPTLLAELRAWRQDDGDSTPCVCPAPRDPAKPIVPEAIEKHYRRTLSLAGKHSPHSWRSAFSTIAREAGKDSDVVESQLDHQVGTKVQSAYDRAKRFDARRELMAWYEETLIAARDGAEVVPIKGRV